MAPRPWPKSLAEQVRAALVEGGRVVTAAEVARGFTGAKAPRVEELLATLAALGQARATDDGGSLASAVTNTGEGIPADAITVDSVPGEGSTFRFTVPLGPGPAK